MSNSESRKKTESVRVRCTKEELEAIRNKASKAGLSASDFIRRSALDRQIRVKTDSQMISTLLQQGGLLKHLYGQMRESMTPELSKQFSEALMQIRKAVVSIEMNIDQV